MTNLLTSRETAAKLNISENTLANWRSIGKGPNFVRLDTKNIRYRDEDIEQWCFEKLNDKGDHAI